MLILGLKLNHIKNGHEATQIHRKTEFEKNPANPSILSRANKVCYAIIKLIIKSIIENSPIRIQKKTELMLNNLICYENVCNLKGLT